MDRRLGRPRPEARPRRRHGHGHGSVTRIRLDLNHADFFLALTGLRIPRLDSGAYRYTVRVRDRIKDSPAEVSLSFEVR